MSDCLFCRLVEKKIQAQIIHEDEETVAFWDIAPQAPTHFLVIPKKHIASIAAMENYDQSLVGMLFVRAKEIAAKMEIRDYRLVINNGAGAGQSVFHIHLHVLAGRVMAWPPG